MRKPKKKPMIELMWDFSKKELIDLKAQGYRWDKRYPWSMIFTGNKKYPKP